MTLIYKKPKIEDKEMTLKERKIIKVLTKENEHPIKNIIYEISDILLRLQTQWNRRHR